MKQLILFIFFIVYVYPMEQCNKSLIISGPYFMMLPVELHSKIIKNVFSLIIGKNIDDHKKKQNILNIPLFLGVKFSQELYDQFQKFSQLKFGKKQFLIEEILCLPIEKRNVLFGLTNRYNGLLFGTIDEDNFNILAKDRGTERDVLSGLKLEVNPLSQRMLFIEGTANFSLLTALIILYCTCLFGPSFEGRVAISSCGIFFGFSIILKSLLAMANWSNSKYWDWVAGDGYPKRTL